MKTLLSFLLITSLILTSAAFASGKKANDCHLDGEFLDSTAENQVDWKNKPHHAEGNHEFFVGLSTQNAIQLEVGKKMAIEDGKRSIIDSLGSLGQPQLQMVQTFDSASLNAPLGGLNSPVILKHAEPVDWYWEKWVKYSDCKPSFYYNVWVLMKIPKNDLDAEREKTIGYLEKAQERELAKEAPALMPDSKLTVTQTVEKTQRIEKPSANQSQTNYLEEMQKTEREAGTKKPWYKSGTFWVITGLVVAGGGAGAYFGLKGGSSGGGSSAGAGGAGSGGVSGGSGAGSVSINVPLPK